MKFVREWIEQRTKVQGRVQVLFARSAGAECVSGGRVRGNQPSEGVGAGAAPAPSEGPPSPGPGGGAPRRDSDARNVRVSVHVCVLLDLVLLLVLSYVFRCILWILRNVEWSIFFYCVWDFFAFSKIFSISSKRSGVFFFDEFLF